MNEMPIKNGKIEGITKAYYEDGNLLSEMPRKNGKSEGMAKRYYPNGNLAIEIPYTNDKINGIIKVYNEGKKLIWQANAQNGKLISGKCSSGKAFTNAHLTRLNKEMILYLAGISDYWYDICEK